MVVVTVTMKRAVSPVNVTVGPEGKWSLTMQGSGGSKAGPTIMFTTAAPSFVHGSGGVKPVKFKV